MDGKWGEKTVFGLRKCEVEAGEETWQNQHPEQRQRNKAVVRFGWENPQRSGQGKREGRGGPVVELAVWHGGEDSHQCWTRMKHFRTNRSNRLLLFSLQDEFCNMHTQSIPAVR